MQAARRLKARVDYLRWLLKLDVWVLEGEETASGEPLRIGFAGSEVYKEDLCARSFRGGHRARYLGKRRAWSLPTRELEQRGCSLIAYEIWRDRRPLFREKSRFRLPVWMRVELDLAAGLDASLRRDKLKKMRRRIRAQSFTSAISRDPADFQFFYHRMYAPYTRTRHEARAVVEDEAGFLKRIPHSELVFACQGGRRIGATLLDLSEGEPHLMYRGILDGAKEHLKTGVSDALYYFALTRAAELGETASLGHCRAFLNDGLVRAKLELGARIAEKNFALSGFLHLRLAGPDPGLNRWLLSRPFVHASPDGYRAVRFVEDARDLPSEALEFPAGLSGADLFAFHHAGDPGALRRCAESGLSIRLFPAREAFSGGRMPSGDPEGHRSQLRLDGVQSKQPVDLH